VVLKLCRVDAKWTGEVTQIVDSCRGAEQVQSRCRGHDVEVM